MSRSLRAMALTALAVALWLSIGLAHTAAQQYPTNRIRILVGFGPGSRADTLARVVGKQIEQQLGQVVIVAQTINPIFNHTGFNLGKDLTPVALLAVVPNVLVAHPSVPANNVRELVALAKAKPETLTFGTSGAGTASHLAAELFNLRAGTKILPVHYAGGSNQAVTDLLAGRITLMFNVAATLAPHVEKGSLKALGMAQRKRAAGMPDVPTMEEQGMTSFDAGIWIGLMAPAGTPEPIVEALSRAANNAIRTELVGSALKTQGMDALGGTPQDFRDFIATDIERWTTVIQSAGLNN
jgi:tripartite-type tricarboxylate transporter receptor subunit TctC